MSDAAPRVFILTDGSGRTAVSRTHYSEGIVDRSGAARGSIFGRHPDSVVYRALLDHDFGLFVGLSRELADAFSEEPPPFVVHDAVEGYNPVHDLCRWLAGAALAMAGQADTPQFEFSTTGRTVAADMRFDLDADAVTRKLQAAYEYAPLAEELRQKLHEHEPVVLQTETFARVWRWDEAALLDDLPQYERFAAARVAAGVYTETIRLRDHLLPLLGALVAAYRVPTQGASPRKELSSCAS
jgi:hypothetical protein